MLAWAGGWASGELARWGFVNNVNKRSLEARSMRVFAAVARRCVASRRGDNARTGCLAGGKALALALGGHKD